MLVLIYAMFTWQSLLGLVRFFVTQDFAEEWPGLVDGTFWCIFLGGGIGLVNRKLWTRWLILSASAGLIIAAATSFFVYDDTSGLFWSAPVIASAILTILPAIFFFAAALSVVKTDKQAGTAKPAAHQPSPRRKQYLLAYGALLFLGLVSLYAAFGLSGDASPDAKDAFIGFFILLPLGLPILAALGLLAWISFKLKDPVLITLFVITVSFLINAGSYGMVVPLVIYGSISIAASVIWYVVSRRREKTGADVGEQ